MISTSVNSVRSRRCLATQHAAAVVAAACVALGLAVSVASAQTNVFATYVGSDGQDSIASLETDASGAVYIAGGMPFDATSLWASTFTAFGQGPAFRISYATATKFAVATAAGVAVLATLLWLTPLPNLDRDGYQTLATPPADAALVDIVFADETTAAQMQDLLADIDGEIVAGPSHLGRYSVRVAGDPSSDQQLDKLIGVLAADPRVRFAGPALTDVQQ